MDTILTDDIHSYEEISEDHDDSSQSASDHEKVSFLFH